MPPTNNIWLSCLKIISCFININFDVVLFNCLSFIDNRFGIVKVKKANIIIKMIINN